MRYFSKEWEKITSDKNILQIVENCKIEFVDDIAPTKCKLYEPTFNLIESEVIDQEIKNLLKMGAVVKAILGPDQFLSSIFVRPKKNGEYRVILNLKNLNEYVVYHHFKMDTFESAVNLVKENCFMASIDIRHAYHTIPIALEHQKYLRFRWKGKIFQYTCLPFGLSSAPRIFTKVLKPIFAKLRTLGYLNMTYIDDVLLFGDTIEECKMNVNITREYLEKFGFVIHGKKSQFQPKKCITFLGNVINSERMTIELTEENKDIIYEECKCLINKDQAKIRTVARVIGLIISSFSTTELGKLHYRLLEMEKIRHLKDAKGNFDCSMPITIEMKEELNWWCSNIHSQIRLISRGNPEITIKTCIFVRLGSNMHSR